MVLDLNHTMNKKLGEGEQSRFEVAVDSIKMLIEQKVSKSKQVSDCFCLVAILEQL